MSTMWDEIRYKVLKSGSNLNLLIGINVLVFLALGIVNVLEMLLTAHSNIHDSISALLQLPAYWPALLTRFWTPFTYLFLHENILSLVFNMLWFYWIGQIFEEYLGSKKLLTVYFIGGIAGAILYILAYNTSPLFVSTKLTALAVGAPACVMAVIVATATLLPDYTIFLMFLGPVKLKWLVLVYVLIDLLSIIGPNSEREFAHLGAALVGFFYIRQLQKGNDWGKAIVSVFAPKPIMKVAVKNQNGQSAQNKKPRQEEIDRILDKISQSGYESLSKPEKEILFRASADDKS